MKKNPADMSSRAVASSEELLKIKKVNKNYGIKDQGFFGITQRPKKMKAK